MTRYLSLAEYLWLAEQVTGIDAAALAKASRLDLADSALHARSAGFGDQDFYPDLIDKAAVLTCRLAWNHPLPDGNKRAAWAGLLMFIDLNGGASRAGSLRFSTRTKVVTARRPDPAASRRQPRLPRRLRRGRRHCAPRRDDRRASRPGRRSSRGMAWRRNEAGRG